MLPNVITLAVDKLNDGNIVNEVLTRFEEQTNRSVYVGESHSIESRDTCTFYRTLPKPNGNFKGVAKTAFKFSRDLLVLGVDNTTSVSAPLIVEVSFSIPIGATEANKLLARQRAIALLDLDDGVMDPLQNQLMI